MAVGAAGADSNELESFNVLFGLLPQPDVYITLALSPVAEAALFVNFILIIRDVSVPESMEALAPRLPTNDQYQPNAVPVRLGAV